MLAEEHILNYLSLFDCSSLHAEVTRSPALHKHFSVVCQCLEQDKYSNSYESLLQFSFHPFKSHLHVFNATVSIKE